MSIDHDTSGGMTRVIHLAPPAVSSQQMRDQITRFDWGRTPLGPLPQWQPSLRIALDMMLQSPFPCALVWGSELTVIHNDDYAALLPERANGLGRCFDQLWLNHWQHLGPWVFKALEGRASFVEDVPLQNSDPQGACTAWHVFSYTPIHDDQGRVAGFLHTAIDTTASVEQLREWRTLAQDFERQINLYMSDRDLLWRLSRDAMIIVSRDLELLSANPAWFQVLGWEVEQVRALPLLDIIYPTDRQEVLLAIDELLQGVEVRDRKSRVRHRDGHYCWINWSARLAGDELIVVGWEITDEHRGLPASELSAVGLADEMNALLSEVRNDLQVLQRHLGQHEGDELEAHVDHALDVLQQAITLSDGFALAKRSKRN